MTVALAFDEHGAGRPLVILHGLYGSKRNWATIAGELAGRFRVLCVDLRNHGTSPWHERHDYPALAADVAELIRTVAGGPAAVLGHSMGGKAAMLLALTEPALVERLVVVDIAPARSPGTAAIDPRVLAAVPLEACPRRADVEGLRLENYRVGGEPVSLRRDNWRHDQAGRLDFDGSQWGKWDAVEAR